MAVHLTRIYTRTGDDGTTGLSDFSRVSKNDARLAAYADCDETNAAIGVAIALGNPDEQIRNVLRQIQNDLFDAGADLSTPVVENPEHPPLRITQSYIDRLESWCDEFNEPLPALNSFVLPGGTPLSALLHVARTVARRAERSAWQAVDTHTDSISVLPAKYLNRLSDLLFILSRVANPAATCCGNRAVPQRIRTCGDARARRRPRLEPRQKRRQRTAIQCHFIALAAFRAGVAQLQNDDLVGHDVELVAARRPSRHDLQAAATQPAVGPPPQAGQPIEAGFPTPVTHYTVAPPVPADGGHIAQDRRRPAYLA